MCIRDRSYIIKITNDLPKNQLTDEQFNKAIEEAMLNANDKNRLIIEKNIDFHGQVFHQQVYLMYTKQWGLLKQYANTLRTNEKMYSIQMSFPVDEINAENATIPQQLLDLNKKIKLVEE